MQSIDWFSVSWGTIPNERVNGILLGYKLTVTMFMESGREVMGAVQYEKIFDIFTRYYKVKNLVNYATYHVKVMGFTAAGDGPCPLLPASKCCYGFNKRDKKVFY